LIVENTAAHRFNQLGNGPQGGALTGAIGANQGDNFPFVDVQINGLQRLDSAVVNRKILKVEQWVDGGFPPQSPR
jgi:hypothetical protein